MIRSPGFCLRPRKQGLAIGAALALDGLGITVKGMLGFFGLNPVAVNPGFYVGLAGDTSACSCLQLL